MDQASVPYGVIRYKGKDLAYKPPYKNWKVVALLVHQGYITDRQRLHVHRKSHPLATWVRWLTGYATSNAATPDQCILEAELGRIQGQEAIILSEGGNPLPWVVNDPELASA